ncbi:SDR family oxidoreductase [Actinomadura sp. NPDC048394]|uniref:SDR family oxidoreductase n=1 Tax=Actinomadura sp. NPDC048394 TaxID=3158223 RepID=UPI0033F4DC29
MNGRLVAVTGAGRGLGLAIAQALGDAGARVVIAERDAGLAAAAAAHLRDRGIEAHRVDTDVSDPGSVAALAEAIGRLGPLHGLVNNAARADGVGGKPFHQIDPGEWDGLMAVNVRGPWLVARALWPHFARPGGRIVNLASDAALYGSPRLAHYVTSKGAVIAMTRAMARDAGEDGVTVNAVAPGLTLGEAAERIPAERHELYRRNRALDRDQEPGDVTGAVLFLLSDAASYITGQTLVVDGGFVFN